MSSGADPMSTIIRFATETENLKKMHAISLGQGQGPIAENLIGECTKTGHWVVLQNCHLAKSWMSKLEKIVEALAGDDSVHKDFRLWLTSMPAAYFPVPVLQASVKMTFEPPLGMRANLKGTWAAMDESVYNSCQEKRMEWLKLLFGITFMHAACQERRKFGPLGWNTRYDFNNTDLEICIETLRMFLDEQPIIPWDALVYVSGQIHYGGRVTDNWDRRNLMSMLRRFYTPSIFDDSYQFANDSQLYHSLPKGTDSLEATREYVNGLPYTDSVGIFGLHANAKITFEKQESDKLLATVTSIQEGFSGGGAGSSPEEIIMALAEKLQSEVPKQLLREDAGENTFQLNEKNELNSLQIVLLHEMSRFNKLLKLCAASLADLGKAIKGLVVMSADLDAMFQAMLKNQVPGNWTKASFLSLKPLSGWIKDLQARCAFFSQWLTGGLPACHPLPYYFFPQGFMTGILQMHARQYAIPIDSLSFSYALMKEETPTDIAAPPPDGVYISGFFMEGARYDRETCQMADSQHKQMADTLPVIHFNPEQNFKRNAADYECPLYKTAVRAGVLSTTGQSTNFVIAVDIPTDRDPDYWVAMGERRCCASSSSERARRTGEPRRERRGAACAPPQPSVGSRMERRTPEHHSAPWIWIMVHLRPGVAVLKVSGDAKCCYVLSHFVKQTNVYPTATPSIYV